MARALVASVTVSRSSLEQDYEYDRDNDVFLFHPSRLAFESSRDKLFLPVRAPQGLLRAKPTILPAPHNFLQSSSIQKRQGRFAVTSPSGRGMFLLGSPKNIAEFHQSVYSDRTVVDHVDEDFYGREEDVLRSMGYSRCICLGLISISAPNWLCPATARDPIPTPAQDNIPPTLGNFFAKLWNKLLRR